MAAQKQAIPFLSLLRMITSISEFWFRRPHKQGAPCVLREGAPI